MLQTVQTVTKLFKQFKLLRIFHLCVCWSGPVIDVWSLHVRCLWCLWCLRFICRICTALSWKSQHQREDWANTLNKCWSLSQTSCSDIVFVFLSIICIISISYPYHIHSYPYGDFPTLPSVFRFTADHVMRWQIPSHTNFLALATCLRNMKIKKRKTSRLGKRQKRQKVGRASKVERQFLQ